MSSFASSYFVTVENVREGMGFSLFSAAHWPWLLATALFIVIGGLWYRRATERQRDIFRKVIAVLLILDELYKISHLLYMGQYLPQYLPFHLCSINIFIIAYYAFKQTETLKNFLYLTCFCGALAALLFPSWSALPPTSFMYIHSFSVHVLLVAFPAILTIGGEIHPNVKYLPKVLLILAAFGALALVLNLLLDTNFMFLMYADTGNPLKFFETTMGSHLWGFPIIMAILVVIMYGPWIIADRIKAKGAQA